MRLSHTQLPAHLERGLAPAYLLAGEEPLLLQEALDAVRAAARARGYSEREVFDAERGFDWSRLLESCRSLSLFAQQRIVELRLGNAPDAAGGAALCELAQQLQPDVLLIVSAGKLETPTRNAAWFAALERAGAAMYIWPLKPEELPRWLEQRLRQHGLQADEAALQRLAQLTEGNLLAAQQDIGKLAQLHPGATLDLATVEAAVADAAHYEALGWANRVTAGDLRGAVRGLAGLRAEGVELLPLLGLVARGLRQLAKAKALQARGQDAGAAAAAAGVFGPSQPAFVRTLARVSQRQALDWLAQCAAIDAKAKSTGLQPAAWEDLLRLVMAASGAADAGIDGRAGANSRRAAR